MTKEIEIPEGYEAKIENNKVIFVPKGSEDERIRKSIADCVSLIGEDDDVFSNHNVTKVQVLAWLKKQKELFKSGRGLYYYDGKKIVYVGWVATEENPYDFAMNQQDSSHVPETWKENADSFTDIKDRKIRGCIGMALADVPESRFKIYGITLKECLAYLENKKESLRNFIDDFPYSAEQEELNYTKRNALFDKCVENCDPKIMKKVSDEVDEMLEKEQKPAEWSKEEKKHLYNAIEAVKYVYDISEGTSGFKCVEFLKSLRPQPHWKPSKKQMKELLNALITGKDFDCDILAELYEQLKKL